MESSDFQIPRDELTFRASRSSGAGGQHVNKTASRVEVVWSVAHSRALSDDQRERLLRGLASRLTLEGELRVVASDTRSQLRNREIAVERLDDLVRKALLVPKNRKPTRPSRAVKAARLAEKKRRSMKKKQRRTRGDE